MNEAVAPGVAGRQPAHRRAARRQGRLHRRRVSGMRCTWHLTAKLPVQAAPDTVMHRDRHAHVRFCSASLLATACAKQETQISQQALKAMLLTCGRHSCWGILNSPGVLSSINDSLYAFSNGRHSMARTLRLSQCVKLMIASCDLQRRARPWQRSSLTAPRRRQTLRSWTRPASSAAGESCGVEAYRGCGFDSCKTAGRRVFKQRCSCLCL